MPESEGLKIDKRLGEKAVKTSRRLGLIDENLKIRVLGDSLIIPLTEKPSEEEVDDLEEVLRCFELSSFRFSRKERTARSLTEALRGRIPEDLLSSLPRSMDIIGSVVIVEVPSELEDWRLEVGRGVLEINRSVETVLAKAGKVRGEHRLRRFEVIAGSGETMVTHREYGCRFHLDPTKVFFTPRLSEERKRVVDQVGEGETVVDMFAGVGAFSIRIGKKVGNAKIYAIDVNPEAFYFLKKNVIENDVEGTVIPICGDVREVAKKLKGSGDRVILDLPSRASEFVDVACGFTKPDGGILHYYCFQSEPGALEKAEAGLKEEIYGTGAVLRRVLHKHCLRQISPRRWHVVVDALVG